MPFGTEYSADHSIRQEVYLNQEPNRPSTPEHIKKYRKSVNGAPGLRQVHYGLKDDVKPVDYQSAFGRQTNVSENLGNVLQA